MLSTFAAVGVAVGIVLGGYLTQYLNWHWIFLVNIPVGIGAILLGRIVIPKDQPDEKLRAALDLSGAVLLFVSLGSFIFTLSMRRTFGYTSPIILSTVALFVLWANTFIFRESHLKEPLIQLALLKNWDYTLGNTGLLYVFILYIGTIFLLPFYFGKEKGFATDIFGLFMLIPALTLIATSVIAGRAFEKIGSRAPPLHQDPRLLMSKNHRIESSI
jgi:predicted MFS family arabinose efflux permease